MPFFRPMIEFSTLHSMNVRHNFSVEFRSFHPNKLIVSSILIMNDWFNLPTSEWKLNQYVILKISNTWERCLKTLRRI